MPLEESREQKATEEKKGQIKFFHLELFLSPRHQMGRRRRKDQIYLEGICFDLPNGVRKKI
jgi:hypothetical protein